MLNFYEMLQTPWDSTDTAIRQAIDRAEQSKTIRPDLLSAMRCMLTDKKLRQEYNQRLADYYDQQEKQQG